MLSIIRRRSPTVIVHHLKPTTTSHHTYSSLAFDKEEHEFSNRKSHIPKSHNWYYPPLTTLRNGLTPTRLSQFRSQFSQFDWPQSQRLESEVHLLEGRIHSVRRAGKGMLFVDLLQDGYKVQVVLMNKLLDESKESFGEYHDQFKKGDHVVAVGWPGVTNVGELSLKCTRRLMMASPIMHPIPPKLSDLEKRHSNKVVDYLVNKRSRDVIVARSKIVKEIRRFLDSRDFLEVDTPIIASNTKGANATPFITSSKHIKDGDKLVDLQLRVAPELWLKKLVIGGFDKVYELGKVFRNEGIDGTHNNEFTTCEFYQSFTTLEELMSLTESMFRDVLEKMLQYEITQEKSQALVNSIGNGFHKLEFIPEVERATGVELPLELTTDSLTAYFHQIQLPLPPIKSVPHLLDRLSSTYLEPQCQDVPTFIYHQPSAMSPLAKSTSITYPNNRTYDISRRFELFIHGSEYVNAYEEENSPLAQRDKFQLQQQWKESYHDDESIVPDHQYLQAMEWGLPPTGGWGLGVDRLCMLLCGEKRIEEVLTFGTLSDVTRQ